MEFTFIVVITSFVYFLTVNAKNRRKIRYLKSKVFELEQTLEMILLYGKEKAEKSKAAEDFKEEERQLDQFDPE